VGVILGSALFQPVALAAIALLMPPPMAIARILFAVALLLGAVPLDRQVRAAGRGGVPAARRGGAGAEALVT